MKYKLAFSPFDLEIEKKIIFLAKSITRGLKNCILHKKKFTKDGFGLRWPLEC
jgi:hypothetical protein